MHYCNSHDNDRQQRARDVGIFSLAPSVRSFNFRYSNQMNQKGASLYPSQLTACNSKSGTSARLQQIAKMRGRRRKAMTWPVCERVRAVLRRKTNGEDTEEAVARRWENDRSASLELESELVARATNTLAHPTAISHQC